MKGENEMNKNLQEQRERSVIRQLKEKPLFISEISIKNADSSEEITDWAKRGVLKHLLRTGVITAVMRGNSLEYRIAELDEDDFRMIHNFLNEIADKKDRIEEAFRSPEGVKIRVLEDLAENFLQIHRFTELILINKRKERDRSKLDVA
jgi:hypothetical protein